MAAGDIILGNGGTVTASDIQQIAAAVKSQLASESKDLSQYENVETLSGVSSLPGFMESGGNEEACASSLVGTQGNGRQAVGNEFKFNGDTMEVCGRYALEHAGKPVSFERREGNASKGQSGNRVEVRK